MDVLAHVVSAPSPPVDECERVRVTRRLSTRHDSDKLARNLQVDLPPRKRPIRNYMPTIRDMIVGPLVIKRKKIQHELVLPIELLPVAYQSSGLTAEDKKQTNDAHVQHRNQVLRDRNIERNHVLLKSPFRPLAIGVRINGTTIPQVDHGVSRVLLVRRFVLETRSDEEPVTEHARSLHMRPLAQRDAPAGRRQRVQAAPGGFPAP